MAMVGVECCINEVKTSNTFPPHIPWGWTGLSALYRLGVTYHIPFVLDQIPFVLDHIPFVLDHISFVLDQSSRSRIWFFWSQILVFQVRISKKSAERARFETSKNQSLGIDPNRLESVQRPPKRLGFDVFEPFSTISAKIPKFTQENIRMLQCPHPCVPDLSNHLAQTMMLSFSPHPTFGLYPHHMPR